MVMDCVACKVDGVIGSSPNTCLVIDESGFTKKRKESVGVARQHNGRLGKVDNCQVGGVRGNLRGKHSTLVDARLFLPDEWVNDPGRCAKVKVPKKMLAAKSKVGLALHIVAHQHEIGLHFSFVCFDGLYGNSGVFLRKLEDMGEIFMAHVHVDQFVYLEAPKPVVPEKTFSKGRTPTKPRSNVMPIRVDRLRRTLMRSEWRSVDVRDSTEGTLKISTHRRTVWLWDGEEPKARKWMLLIRKDESGDIKYALPNSVVGTPVKRLAYTKAQRFWIERSLSRRQKHGWLARNHHIAMCMMPLLFILKHKIIHGENEPLLNANDTRYLLASLLPRKNRTFKDVLE